jgi:hypothetical protein
MAARDEDFLNDGTVDPFTGLAPAMTPEEEATQRLMKLRYAAQQTSGANVGFQRGQQHGDTTPTTPEEQAAYDAYAKAHHLGNYSRSLGYNLARDPVTMGVLAAPAAITGLGAAVGGAEALGFGLGDGTLAGTSAAPFATAGTDTAAAEAAVNAAHIPAAAGSASASAASAPLTAGGFATKYALPALAAVAPLAIQQMTKGQTKEQKQLIELQKQMALEAQQRQGQLQDQRMNQLGQQILAFNPTNQLMAQMYGPQAAFQPEQAAQMVQGQEPPMDPNILNYMGTDQNVLKQKQEMIRRHNEWLQSEGQRRDMVMGGFQAPGAGPAPITMPAPQAARKF